MPGFLIRNAVIIDGSGAERFTGSVETEGGRIVRVERGVRPGPANAAASGTTASGAPGAAAPAENAPALIDGTGLTVTPGFIDAHTHGDITALADPLAANLLLQGVTTEIAGQCGDSLSPICRAEDGRFTPVRFADIMLDPRCEEEKQEIYRAAAAFPSFMAALSSRPLGCNMLLHVGHGALRRMVMGKDHGAPGPEQMKAMKSLVREAMEAGALGLSTGLFFSPGSFASTEEIVELCRVAAEYGGRYSTHLRSEAGGLVDAVKEALEIAARAGVKLVLSHHKAMSRQNWGKPEITLGLIDNAVRRGIDVSLDQYPYATAATALISLLPPEFLAEGSRRVIESLGQPSRRREIRAFIEENRGKGESLLADAGGPGGLTIPGFPQNGDPYNAFFDALAESRGKAMALFPLMDERDVERIMRHPLAAFGTDSTHSTFFNPFGHPRAFGAFPRVLCEYALKRGALTLEEAVRKATSLPAGLAGLSRKGLVREGFDADLLVLDLPRLRVHSSEANPNAGNEGFKFVFVDGKAAVKDDKTTGVLAGRVIKRP